MEALAASTGQHVGEILFGLLLAISALAVIANVIKIPYPILLVLGGLAFGLIPGVPEIELDPDIVLLIFLPPLLYSAAFFANLRELRANVRPITLLAVGLVLITMVVVAVVAHEVIGLEWSVAFVLGAVVSPTDAVAPAEILRRLGAPRRIIDVVEGENLTNDWTALVAYKFAVAAVVTGTFSLAEAVPEFFLTGLGGIAIGIAVGVVIAAVRRRIDDPPSEITISLLTAYAAYLPAEELGLSGVIAAVTTGVWLGWRASELTNHTTRLQLTAVWSMLQFLLNAVLFVLVGLQFPVVLDELAGRPTGELIGYAALISGIVIVVRLLWVYSFRWGLAKVLRRVRGDSYTPNPWRNITLVGWSGMRGSVCLAAALAIPLETDAGAAFPDRDLVIFLAFCVILATLVVQGLLFPALIRALEIEDDTADADEELAARLEIAYSAIDTVESLSGEDWVMDGTPERVRQLYEYRTRRFQSSIDDSQMPEDDDTDYEARASQYVRFMREVIGSQRATLRSLRDQGRISDDVRRRVEYDLDLEEARLGD
jgi:CPA1 family monovalent cation:H+ antiporter